MKNKLKIALVNPRIESLSGSLPPLGILIIAALLEQNDYDVRVFDLYPYDNRDIPSLVLFLPDVIGITVLTDYLPRAVEISQIIRKRLPDSTFIAGGVHITALPEESIQQFGADICVIGEGEYTMLELCDHLSKGSNWKETKGIAYKDDNNNVIITSPRPFITNLDDLPFPARHLLKFEDYLIPPGRIRGTWSERSTTVMTGRGCPFKCIWCGSQCTFGHRVRYRSVDNVLDELELLIHNYQIDTIWLIDDTFTLSKKRVAEFCKKIIKRNLKLTLGCQAHVKTADENMFKLMKRAGFVQVDFGVESGSDKVLKTLKKNSDALSIKMAFLLAKKAGLRTMATFMFGSPSETKEDVEATMRLAKEINPNFVSSFFITPYPGTELMEMAITNNWISPYVDRAMAGLRKGPMLKIHFSEKELLNIRSRFQKMFFFRNYGGLFLSPNYVFKIAILFLRYPLGIVLGIKKFLKTFVFDDLVFEFVVYYTKEKINKKI
ncbi:B12-binding domain-containing radical SAM protein [Desulfobacula sp.]|uniref:B12-binding domain-containing radical SAM protein n=1 Tax=Desulfobacula sp. TaxID=2593537 RepID=UPI001ECCEFE5|nr:radical SAM protein [Desulfobacula sp.]